MTIRAPVAQGDRLVSVVLPTRNRARWLGRAIESVLRQTLVDLELIVVDDGSEDETAAVLARYAAADARIGIERVEKPGGAAAARNAGIARAKGRFVAFIDDDVVWAPTKLERQLRQLDAVTAPGLAYCAFIRFDAGGARRRIGSAAAAGDRARSALLRGNVIDTSCAVVRRDLLIRIGGFDERLPRLQDWDLWLRLAEATSFVYDPEPLVDVPHVPGGISSDASALIDACTWLATKHGARLDRRARAVWLTTLGHTLLTNGAPGAGRRLLWQALRVDPLSPRCGTFAAASLLGARAYNRLAGLRARISDARRRSPGSSARRTAAHRSETAAEDSPSIDSAAGSTGMGDAWRS